MRKLFNEKLKLIWILFLNKWNKKPTKLEFILVVLVTACITAKFKQSFISIFMERAPGGSIEYKIYDHVEPKVPLQIHEYMRHLEE